MSILATLQRLQSELVNETNAGAIKVELSARTFDRFYLEIIEMIRNEAPCHVAPNEAIFVQTVVGVLRIDRERDDSDPRRPTFRRSDAFGWR